MRNFLHPNLWKFALGSGLVAVIVLIWNQNNTSSPLTPVPITDVETITPQPPATFTPAPTTIVTVHPPRSIAPCGRAQGPMLHFLVRGGERLPTITQNSLPTSPSTLSTNTTESATDEPPPQTPTFTPTPIPVYHIVQPGDMLLSIAITYDISVDTLMEINQITDPTLLQIGQQLLIPVTVTSTPSQPSPTPTPTSTPIYHTIQANQTLVDIAREYDVNLEIIKLANNITPPQALQTGQQLLIPPSTIGFDTPTTLHIIESGDTFDRLAFYYNSTTDDIVAANPDLNPAALSVGQQVIVPSTSPAFNPNANPRSPQIIWPEPPAPHLITLQQQLFDGTNIYRQENGLPPLQADADLAQIALGHAQDMVKRGYLAHITPEGVNLRTRFEQHGVEANWIGENIQRNTAPENQTAASALNWLINSPPHRSNLLHVQFNRLGVGVIEEPPGWYTFVQVFAKQEAP